MSHLRHIHPALADRLRGREVTPAWIRKIEVQAPREIIENEHDGAPRDYLELWTSLLLERPGFPPMAGIATETDIGDSAVDVEAGTCPLSLYYYTRSEISDPALGHEAFSDTGRRYHEDEEVVDFPAWILPEDPYEDAYATADAEMGEDTSTDAREEGEEDA